MPSIHDITGVILAGGRASRMGGEDKGLVNFSGRPLIEHVLERLSPQVDAIIINANRNLERYRTYATVVADSMDGYAGPLAGMLAAMNTADSGYILTVPCDSPFLPTDLAPRLLHHLPPERPAIAVAHDGVRMQPVFALIDCRLRQSLYDYLHAGERKIDLWYHQHDVTTVDYSDQPDTFININRPEELSSEAHRIQEMQT